MLDLQSENIVLDKVPLTLWNKLPISLSPTSYLLLALLEKETALTWNI
jgi:hypothetical protein